MEHEDFTLDFLSEKLSKYLKTDCKTINFNTRFKSNELDTALRGDYQVANSMDYSFLRKCKTKIQTGSFHAK